MGGFGLYTSSVRKPAFYRGLRGSDLSDGDGLCIDNGFSVLAANWAVLSRTARSRRLVGPFSGGASALRNKPLIVTARIPSQFEALGLVRWRWKAH